jgi:hypothetical protein
MSEETEKVKFVVNESLKMGELLRAETSYFLSIDLMAKYANHPDGHAMTREELYALIEDMNELEYLTMWNRFRAASVPKVNGRR